jgi:hypothetical protein
MFRPGGTFIRGKADRDLVKVRRVVLWKVLAGRGEAAIL